MADKNMINFYAQADQMLNIIESRLRSGQKQAARNFLILKFKSLYEQGVASGRVYERDGVYPYNEEGDEDNPET
jgi:hypothetical protein